VAMQHFLLDIANCQVTDHKYGNSLENKTHRRSSSIQCTTSVLDLVMSGIINISDDAHPFRRTFTLWHCV